MVASDGSDLVCGDEWVIATGLESTGPDGVKLMEPRVSYLSDVGYFLIIWTRIEQYADAENAVYKLMMAIFDEQGHVIVAALALPHGESSRLHVHDVACAANRCLLVYREASGKMVARVVLDTGELLPAMELDDAPGYHSYARVAAGAVVGANVDFYASYVVATGVYLTRLRTIAARPHAPTPTPTLTPTATLTPTVTPTIPCEDQYEPDDTWQTAGNFDWESGVQQHNFHQPYDLDFVRLDVRAGQHVVIGTEQLSEQVDTILRIYDHDGITQLAYNDDAPGAAPASLLFWEVPEDGVYYLELANADAGTGCDARYVLRIATQARLYLPVILS
jgi:hypothetical protein